MSAGVTPAKKLASTRPAKKAPAKKTATKKAAPRKRAPAKKAEPTLVSLKSAAPPPPEEPPAPEPDVFDPAYEAHMLNLRGGSWPDIAEATGYASAAQAALAVRSYLTRAALAMDDEMRAAALTLSLERHQAILKAWWLAGTTGMDDKAANILLKTQERIDKLLRIDREEAAADGTRTLIIAGATPDEYTAQLRAAVEGRQP